MTTTIGARIEDERLLSEIDEKAEKYGSRSEAVRAALREALLEDDDGDNNDSATELPRKAAAGYEAIREFWEVGDTLEIETAESIIAQELQISTEVCRRAVIKPLVNRRYLLKRQTMRAVFIEVAPSKTEPITDGGTPLNPAEYEHTHYCEAREQIIHCPMLLCNHCLGWHESAYYGGDE